MMGLFGCEYRSGRAKSAPLLRPLGSDGQPGGHLADKDLLPTFALDEVEYEREPHDASRLPHLHSVGEIAKLFPRIAAAPQQENCADWIPGSEMAAW